jgi:hypothetical protein
MVANSYQGRQRIRQTKRILRVARDLTGARFAKTSNTRWATRADLFDIALMLVLICDMLVEMRGIVVALKKQGSSSLLEHRPFRDDEQIIQR